MTFAIKKRIQKNKKGVCMCVCIKHLFNNTQKNSERCFYLERKTGSWNVEVGRRDFPLIPFGMS